MKVFMLNSCIADGTPRAKGTVQDVTEAAGKDLLAYSRATTTIPTTLGPASSKAPEPPAKGKGK